MIVKPNGNSGKFIKLVVEGLNYLGPEDLTQYFVRETKIYWKEDGTIHMIVVLGRRLLGNLSSNNLFTLSKSIYLGTALTIYIPTLLLICISYVTNFFKPFFFEAVVAVNLTCMLV